MSTARKPPPVMTDISGQPKKAGVIGYPVTHSLSPALHGYWLKHYGIEGSYVPLETPPDQLEHKVRSLIQQGFAGANLTLPHKELILPMLDSIDATAQAIGAVNTLIFRDGKMHGTNTDAYGFMENISPHLTGKHKAVVLGAGGAAKAVVFALAEAGFKDIIITNRSVDKAEELANNYQTASAAPWEKRGAILEGADLLVNATSLGLAGKAPLDMSLDALPTSALVTDIVYAPLITELLKNAAARANPIVDGLGMLLHQAAPGFEAWFGQKPEVTQALRDAVLATKNEASRPSEPSAMSHVSASRRDSGDN